MADQNTIESADGYIVVCGEYNRTIPRKAIAGRFDTDESFELLPRVPNFSPDNVKSELEHFVFQLPAPR